MLPNRKPRFLAMLLVAACAILVPIWLYSRTETPVEVARGHLAVGETADALRVLEALELARRDDPEVQFLLGVASRREGQSRRAEACLARAESLGWPSKEIAFQRMLLRAQAGDVLEAQAYLTNEQLGDVDDQAAEQIYEALARGYLATYRTSDADQCLTYWINWLPDRVTPRMWRADLGMRLQKFEMAIDEYEAILARHPDHIEARINLAKALLILNQVERAYEELNQLGDDVVRSNPKAALAMSEAFHRMGNEAKARSLAMPVASNDVAPELRAEALAQLAKIALEAGHAEEAERFARESLSLNPHEAASYNALGRALTQQGKPEEAAQQFEKLAAIRRRLNRLVDITEDIATDPSNADLRFEVGQIFWDQGMRDEAARWWKTALQVDPKHQQTLDALARAESSNESSTVDHSSRLDPAQVP